MDRAERQTDGTDQGAHARRQVGRAKCGTLSEDMKSYFSTNFNLFVLVNSSGRSRGVSRLPSEPRRERRRARARTIVFVATSQHDRQPPSASRPMCGSMSCMVDGGAHTQLAPHRLYVFARFLTPPKGV